MTESGSSPPPPSVQELERRWQIAESLRGTLAILNSNLPIDTILTHIVNQACPLLDADAAAIYRLQLNGILSIQAAVGLEDEYIRTADIPLGISATGRAMLTQNPVYFEDVLALAEDPALSEQPLAQVIRLLVKDFSSILSIPLLLRSEAYGVLTLYYKEPRRISEEELALARDFSLQAALAIENARLRLQIEQNAVAAERNRLARELHDSVTQNLFSASLIAEVLPRIWKRNQEAGLQGLEEIRQLTHGALAEMRSLLLELRPHALEETRRDQLFRQLTEAVSGRIRKPVELRINGQPLLPVEVRLAFYRIAQEALNNITKHTQAEHIEVRLDCSPPNSRGQCSWAALFIADDGCGFDETQEDGGHFGVKIMKERAQSIGATIRIESQIDCGTQIHVLWQSEEDNQTS